MAAMPEGGISVTSHKSLVTSHQSLVTSHSSFLIPHHKKETFRPLFILSFASQEVH